MLFGYCVTLRSVILKTLSAFIIIFSVTNIAKADSYNHWFYDNQQGSQILKNWHGDPEYQQSQQYVPIHPDQYQNQNQYRDYDRRPQPKHLDYRDHIYNTESVRRPKIRDARARHHNGFGRLFRADRRRGRIPNRVFNRLASTMMEPRRQAEHKSGDSWVPAGYTFLGQFIDHDITFDTTSMLGLRISEHNIRNDRTPGLDLDSVYGGGPDRSPYLYNLPYLRIGKRLSGYGFKVRFDFLRTQKSNRAGPQGGAARALIGDPRNDENYILGQLHSVFIAFHNRLVDIIVEKEYAHLRDSYCPRQRRCGTRQLAKYLSQKTKKKIFESAHDHVIHYYHRMILEDYLPRVIGRRLVHDIVNQGRHFYYPNGFLAQEGRIVTPFIPLEFMGAAYRYGHSQVRETFHLRQGVRKAVLDRHIRAFQPLRKDLLIDWKYFFPLQTKPPYGFNFARKIDRKITFALFHLGRSNVVPRNEVISLPARNLIRGQTLALPSGQEVASQVLPVMYKRGLLDGEKARYRRRQNASWQQYLIRPDRHIQNILRTNETPLWYYLLQEAELFGGRSRNERSYSRHSIYNHRRGYYKDTSYSYDYNPKAYNDNGGHLLGPVGGMIVGEVILGLMDHYTVQTGKGLKFRPYITASLRPDYRSPLSFTRVPNLRQRGSRRRYRTLYMMRNLIIDAGMSGNPLRRYKRR